MPKFTNISNGPRGIHTAGGLVMVEKGQTVEADLAENEEPNEEWFAKAGTAAAKSADADPLDHDGDGTKGGTKPASK